MDHPAAAHHGEHAAGNPQGPAAWPLVVGLGAVLIGAMLAWWADDTDNEVAGVFLGAAIVASLGAIALWIWDDGRLKRKADEHQLDSAKATQVITFALAEGSFEQAREAGGVLAGLERAMAELHRSHGFVDLRINASPASTGTSPVVVETTWARREDLDAADSGSLLDVISRHAEVVAGSVQAFDMQVVRDSKIVSFKFGLGPAFGLFLAFLVGGAAVGSALTLFENERVVEKGGGGGTAPAGPVTEAAVRATDNKLNPTRLTLKAATEVTVNFENRGKVPHNLAFYDREGGADLAPGAKGEIIDGGKAYALKFTTPAAGTFFYRCDVHPAEMKGQLVTQ